MVLLCLLSSLLSYNVKRIIENWKDTKAKAVGNTIELIIRFDVHDYIKEEIFFYFSMVYLKLHEFRAFFSLT